MVHVLDAINPHIVIGIVKSHLFRWESIFRQSGINLILGIQSGVPQRAFDILASGGFLLSNYQQELVELFSYGEEMVVYESLEDAVEKCNFYLSNQELRGKIARKGRERVLTEHNMVDKIRYMIDVAEV